MTDLIGNQSIAPERACKDALLIFVNPLAFDLARRRMPRSAAGLLRLLPTTETARVAGCDVHVFQRHGAAIPSIDEAGAMHHGQMGEGFGARLEAAIAELSARGYTRIVVVGRDCPDLSTTDVQAAFTALRAGHDWVLGPDHAGGCYLIGLHAGSASALRGIRWHCGADFAALVERTARVPRLVLDPKADVDNVHDLRRIAAAGAALSALATLILARVTGDLARACNVGLAFVFHALQALRVRQQLAPPVAGA